MCIHKTLASHASFQVLHVFGEEARLGDKAQRRGKCNQLLCSKLETLPYSFLILQFILTLNILPCASQLIKIKQIQLQKTSWWLHFELGLSLN